MSGFVVPKGLKKWNFWIRWTILRTPFPPRNEPSRNETPNWGKLSTCELLCEEVLDTVPLPGLLTQYYQELIRRGS